LLFTGPRLPTIVPPPTKSKSDKTEVDRVGGTGLGITLITELQNED